MPLDVGRELTECLSYTVHRFVSSENHLLHYNGIIA